MSVSLGINIDHVATLRNARGETEPEPVLAAAMAELGGADAITIHLREDRRHIRERDVMLIRGTSKLPLNLEMACIDEIVKIALQAKPNLCTLVPEKREELTTEGGLDAIEKFDVLERTVKTLMNSGIEVSIFVDPDIEQIRCCHKTGAKYIELHTGGYAASAVSHLTWEDDKPIRGNGELAKLILAAEFAQELGLTVNAGHGLNYQNTAEVARIRGINELNIGHSIIARAVFVGLVQAVKDMKEVINRCLAAT
ncbi:MAG: pyridoxine 5'-phosphate synthase [Deferribacteraceae bacterium]|jgi:pyridoxine 5-phosphate synthase|nr:pyridoxine 5'-phosphate synthase [Deferribacteraceae bacterium]